MSDMIGPIFSSIMSSNASEDAANKQLQASEEANQLQWKMYKQNRTDMEPWRTAGASALNQISAGTQPGGQYSKFTMADFQADPGYAFRQQQGQDAIRAGSSAAGNFGSGNMGVALQNYGQNTASNEYASSYGRWMDQYNRLAGIAGTGQNQSQAMATMGQNTANTMGANTISGGNAQAQGIIGSANAWGNAFQNVSNSANSNMGTYMNYMNQQNMMNSFGLNSGGATGASGSGGYGGFGDGSAAVYSDSAVAWA